MLSQETQRLLSLEKELANRVVDQPTAVTAVANAIRRNKVGIGEEGKPIGSFIFLGPTGVGKTELAKTLAGSLFNDEKRLVRIDMSEYMEKHSVARLIGSPPGYVGYEEGGQLTEAVRRHPYSIILFDEIEKAHTEVFNVLLQVLDDGRLTDAKGRTVDFKNTVIIMTSNLASQYITEHANDLAKQQELVQAALRQTFKPEFLNRIDDVVIFQPLNQASIAQIVRLQLDKIKERLAKKDITVNFDDSVQTYLSQHGYDQLYGARPLKREIQLRILDPLAMKLLETTMPANHKLNLKLSNTGELSIE
jgi:ATP-dependent Clp protease ATP-binding subunit ClpB